MPRKILLEIKKDELLDEINTFEIEGQSIAVYKIGDGYYAFPDTCTHEEWPLSESYLDDGLIICSLHGAAFNPQTGACHRGPATDPLIPYIVRHEDETLFIELEVAP